MGISKIIINLPSKSKYGGVISYYTALEPYWKLNVFYFTIGSRNGIPTILRMPLDYLKFFFKIILLKPDVILLNPSLGLKAVLRDSLFLIICNLLGVPTIVFFPRLGKKN
jgi:hypothetical protein